jgi:hypothetical protein
LETWDLASSKTADFQQNLVQSSILTLCTTTAVDGGGGEDRTAKHCFWK